MTTSSLEIQAFLKRESQLQPFFLRISEPRRTEGEDDYCCRVHVPALLKRDAEIFGIDAAQARELAEDFVKNLLGELTLVNGRGDPYKMVSRSLSELKS